MQPNKVIICIAILFALIIGSSIFSQKVLSSTAKELENHLDKIEGGLKASNWDSSSKEISEIDDSWQRIKKYWAVMLDHFEIDNIDVSLTKLTKYIESKDLSSSMAEAATLRNYVDHIPEKESLLIKNIF